MDSHHDGQWPGVLMFFDLRLNGWANNGDAGDFRRHCAYYNVSVMIPESETRRDRRNSSPDEEC